MTMAVRYIVLPLNPQPTRQLSHLPLAMIVLIGVIKAPSVRRRLCTMVPVRRSIITLIVRVPVTRIMLTGTFATRACHVNICNQIVLVIVGAGCRVAPFRLVIGLLLFSRVVICM